MTKKITCLPDDEKDILNEVLGTYYDPVQALLEFKPNYYDLLIFDYWCLNFWGVGGGQWIRIV